LLAGWFTTSRKDQKDDQSNSVSTQTLFVSLLFYPQTKQNEGLLPM